SGWLSMDHGRLFSLDKLSDAEAKAITGSPAWATLSPDELQRLPPQAREIEWFAFAGRVYRRDRIPLLGPPPSPHEPSAAAAAAPADRAFLTTDEVSGLASALAPGCNAASAITAGDNYAIEATMPDAPVYRLVCGELWYHIDPASGAALEKLDASRRAYRWFYSALHTLDFPALLAAPALRTLLIVALCMAGLAFS